MTKRCSRSWRRTRCRASPRSSPWPTSVPGPQRAVHGTLLHKTGPPQLVAPQPLPRVVAKRRKTRTAVATDRRLNPRLLQQHQGVRTRGASARAHRVVIVAHALSTPTPITALLTAARFRNSRSASAGAMTRPPRTPLLLLQAGSLARRRPLVAIPPLQRRSWGTNPQLAS